MYIHLNISVMFMFMIFKKEREYNINYSRVCRRRVDGGRLEGVRPPAPLTEYSRLLFMDITL